MVLLCRDYSLSGAESSINIHKEYKNLQKNNFYIYRYKQDIINDVIQLLCVIEQHYSYKLKINIYLISTVHKEKGNCTSESLFEILNRIKPDVVFCEVSPKMFESFKEGLIHTSLELNSIEKLSKYHSFSFVAIDSYPAPDLNFRNQINELFDIIDKDKKFSNAWRKNNENTHLFGFEYLNSDESIQLFDEMAKRGKIITTQLDNLEYKNVYEKWLSFQDNRENEMVKNINSYAKNNEFENAVFLCGSAHRKTISNKIKEKKNIQLKWNFELPK